MRRKASFALGLVLLGLSGCGLLGKQLEKPQVSVQSVSIAEVGFSGATGVMDLTITNPNAVALPLTSIAWELAVHGDRAVTGRIDLREEIPAKGSAPVRTTLQITASDLVRVAPHLAAGERDYRLGARLTFATSLGELSVDIAHDGTL